MRSHLRFVCDYKSIRALFVCALAPFIAAPDANKMRESARNVDGTAGGEGFRAAGDKRAE